MPRVIDPREKREILRLSDEGYSLTSIAKLIGVSRPTVSKLLRETKIIEVNNMSARHLFEQTARAIDGIDSQFMLNRRTFEMLKTAAENPTYGNVIQEMAAENNFLFSGGRIGVQTALYNMTRDYSTEQLKQLFIILNEVLDSLAENHAHFGNMMGKKQIDYDETIKFIKYTYQISRIKLSLSEIKRVASTGRATLETLEEYKQLVMKLSKEYNIQQELALFAPLEVVNEFYKSEKQLRINKEILEEQEKQIERNRIIIEAQESRMIEAQSTSS